MTGQLLVTPEQLISASNEFSASNSQVKNITSQMLDIVRSMSASWEGEANTAYLNKFNQLEDDMEKIFRMINEHVDDLQEMASNYQLAESTNVDTAGALSGDVIS